MKKYGKIISKLRKEKGLTQEALGKKLNVSYQAVSKWENDLSEPDLGTLEKLVGIFEISMSDFFALSNKDLRSEQNVQAKSDVCYSQLTNENKLDNKPDVFDNFVKTKPWLVVAALGIAAIFLSFFVFLIPAKFTSEQIFNKINPSVFCITAEGSNEKQAGSGFFISNNGLAVTNYHVIQNCTSAKIQLNDGKIYSVLKVVGCDESKDIAIIQIDIAKSKRAIMGNSNRLKVGQTVYAIGYPESFILGSVDSTFTQGIISKTSYSIDGNTYIQSTVDVTNGNSGGVLIDENGKIIGITTATFKSANYINMCIPINEVKSIKRNVNLSLKDYYNLHKTIDFYSDGLIIASKKYKSGDKISRIEPPSKTGYIFDDWYTSYDYTEKIDFERPLTNQTKCFAKWIPNQYVIRFNSSGVSGVMQDFKVNYDEEIQLPKNAFVYPHYKFVKWTNDDKKFAFDDCATIRNLTENDGEIIDLYANWEMETYSLNFDGNGADSGNMDSLKLGYFDSISLPNVAYSKTGYLFKYWQCNDRTLDDEQEITQLGGADEQITLSAVWEPITYFIEFNSNNGTDQKITQEIKYDQTVKLLANTFSYLSNEQLFYKWICSYQNKNLIFEDQQEVLNLTSVNNQILTFEAWWIDYYYVFKYDSDGGEGTFKDEKVTRHTSHYLPKDKPYKYGYRFFGWEYDGQKYWNNARFDDVDFGIEDKPKEIVFVAQYTLDTYTVYYYESCESESSHIYYKNLMGTQTMTYHVPSKLRSDFTIPGRKINYWVRFERSGNFNFSGYVVSKDIEQINLGTVELVADWIGVEFDVVYHNLNGPDDDTEKTVRMAYDAGWGSDSLINAIKRELTASGYQFTGWTFDGVFYEKGTKISFADDMKVEENGTYHLYANWEDAATCTIQFYANGGEGEMQSIVVYTNESFYLPECLFTKTGYTFRFWSINKECDVDSTTVQDFNRYKPGRNIDFAIKPGATITLWANWLKNDE